MSSERDYANSIYDSMGEYADRDKRETKMKETKEYISWDLGSELPVSTFHCHCGEVTEGFSICLKCNP